MANRCVSSSARSPSRISTVVFLLFLPVLLPSMSHLSSKAPQQQETILYSPLPSVSSSSSSCFPLLPPPPMHHLRVVPSRRLSRLSCRRRRRRRNTFFIDISPCRGSRHIFRATNERERRANLYTKSASIFHTLSFPASNVACLLDVKFFALERYVSFVFLRKRYDDGIHQLFEQRIDVLVGIAVDESADFLEDSVGEHRSGARLRFQVGFRRVHAKIVIFPRSLVVV